MDNQQPKSGLNNTQKTGFVLLLVFGVLTVGLGFLQMRNNIYNPFAQSNFTQADQLANLFDNEEIRLQTIDTDRDGISDWEELNFYETSPYLPDTDSDGIDDKKEIDMGEDPLCLKGGVCDLEAEVIEAIQEDTLENALGDGIDAPEDVLSGVLNTDGLTDNEDANQVVADVEDLLNNPDRIREMLLATGSVTEEQLLGVDDEQILILIQEILLEQSAGLEANTN